MGALANREVGKFLNENFVSSFQKVGTFRIVETPNGPTTKQGWNVASYFCAPDGRVLHVVAGPVDAATMLREARWVVETTRKALAECKDDGAAFKAYLRKAHVLLTVAPAPRLGDLYRAVFEGILGEKRSTNPVEEGRR